MTLRDFTMLALLSIIECQVVMAKEPPPFVNVTDQSKLQKLFVEHSEIKDPFSIQFRRAQIRETRDETGTTRFWCGQLNAKNSLGAYVGWADFLVLEFPHKDPHFDIDAGETAGMSRVMIDTLCGTSLIRGGS